ncbi:hypothetical protein QR680_016392 [Steinernema hermaphroditum]|uniref:7TM GPCR serpentine receptor class x (Srx) domain-containing protein n=1 Tax=Steinernema hermaphroditum TaxID=289476 RepID=A0AA39HBE3_9BILA|nr:hypothetical protein QR680_016392 [Steinernema hermaphroditum]
MENCTLVYGHELLGRKDITPMDLLVGLLILAFCSLQIAFGFVNLWILWNVKIFYNSFGTILATRALVDMSSSVLHICYSSYVTISQRADYSPYMAIVAGYLGYILAGMSCSMHVFLAVNRFTSVYFPLQYRIIFKKENCVRITTVTFIAIIIAFIIPFTFIPCNLIGYSASHYGYIMLDCRKPEEKRPFHFGRFLHVACGALLCFGAIVIDTATIRKLYVLKSFCQNIPMFIELVLLTLGDSSPDSSKAFNVTLSFLVTRFTDFVNSTTIIVFNPEARKFLQSRARLFPTSSISSSRNIYVLPGNNTLNC